ncbi:unnamed protein product [Linum trigynum]
MMGIDHHLHQANSSFLRSPYCLATTLLLVLLLTISTSTAARPPLHHNKQHQRPPPLPPADQGLSTDRWKLARRPPPPAAVGLAYRYSATDGDAFRPTNRGHSPGVGHDSPPTAP